jgi:hypothetical protein
MKKSFPIQDTIYIEDKHNILKNPSNSTFDNIIIDDQSLINIKEDPSSYKYIFKNSSSTLDNIINPDLQTGKISIKYFKCEVQGCGKIYKSKENLTLHIKNIHLNLKPYKCRFCNSLFSHRNGIKQD